MTGDDATEATKAAEAADTVWKAAEAAAAEVRAAEAKAAEAKAAETKAHAPDSWTCAVPGCAHGPGGGPYRTAKHRSRSRFSIMRIG